LVKSRFIKQKKEPGEPVRGSSARFNPLILAREERKQRVIQIKKERKYSAKIGVYRRVYGGKNLGVD